MSALIRAEILKLRRRRGLMIWTAVLAFAPTLIVVIVGVTLHAVNPDHHSAAGGTRNAQDLTALVVLVSTLAAIIVGSTAGGQDVATGVFRDLVVTGRSRGRLFDARIPGALIVFLSFILVDFVVIVAVAYAFAGGESTSAAGLAHSGVYLLVSMIFDVGLAIALSAMLSRGIVIGVLIGWQLVVANIIVSIKALGGWRGIVDVAALDRLGPQDVRADGMHMSLPAAVVVVLVWAAVFYTAARVVTNRRDA